MRTDLHKAMNPQLTQICPCATRLMFAHEKERFHENLLGMLYVWCVILYNQIIDLVQLGQVYNRTKHTLGHVCTLGGRAPPASRRQYRT